MYIFKAMITQRMYRLSQITKALKVTIFFLFIVILYLGFLEYKGNKTEDKQTLKIISAPQINDIYFF